MTDQIEVYKCVATGKTFTDGDYSLVPKKLGTACQAIDQLISEDPTFDGGGCVDQPRFLYRGQRERYQLRSWPPDKVFWFEPHAVKLESIIPYDYRGVESAVCSANVATGKYGDTLTHWRSVVTWFLLRLCSGLSDSIDDELSKWLKEQCEKPSGQRFDAVGSLGQHYGLRTQYLDLTSDVKTAFWFSMYNWNAGKYCPESPCIYRINVSALNDAMTAVNKAHNRVNSDMLRCVDIRSTPHQIAPRASNQHGWSVIHFENPFLQFELRERGGVELFEFDAEPVPKVDQLSRKIQPVNDLMDRLSSTFCKTVNAITTVDSAQQWVNTHWNEVIGRSGLIDLCTGNWMEKYLGVDQEIRNAYPSAGLPEAQNCVLAWNLAKQWVKDGLV
jgi:hypothetical protein